MEFAGRAGVFRKVGQVPGASQRAAGSRSSYYLAWVCLAARVEQPTSEHVH
ncbi:PAS sensor protein, partial [Pseudomonas aeruginosa]